jgi:hypothetical protein
MGLLENLIYSRRKTFMAKLITTAERIAKAEKLIQQARTLPRIETQGWLDLSYVAGVKDLLRQARDLVKFIPDTSGVDPELKIRAKEIVEETRTGEKEILHPQSGS